MTGLLLFVAGGALGALGVLALASPGTWPPRTRRRPDAQRLRRERESWLR